MSRAKANGLAVATHGGDDAVLATTSGGDPSSRAIAPRSMAWIASVTISSRSAARIASVAIAAVGACDGDDEKTCVPQGSYVFPADCEVADCRAQTCDVTCESGTTCGRLDCSRSPQCRIDCQPGATCGPTDCRDAEVCFVACHGAASTCEATCEGAQICSLTCYDGAECLLRCGSTPASACRYDMCSGGSGMVDCGGGVIACNRACP